MNAQKYDSNFVEILPHFMLETLAGQQDEVRTRIQSLEEELQELRQVDASIQSQMDLIPRAAPLPGLLAVETVLDLGSVSFADVSL